MYYSDIYYTYAFQIFMFILFSVPVFQYKHFLLISYYKHGIILQWIIKKISYGSDTVSSSSPALKETLSSQDTLPDNQEDSTLKKVLKGIAIAVVVVTVIYGAYYVYTNFPDFGSPKPPTPPSALAPTPSPDRSLTHSSSSTESSSTVSHNPGKEEIVEDLSSRSVSPVEKVSLKDYEVIYIDKFERSSFPNVHQYQIKEFAQEIRNNPSRFEEVYDFVAKTQELNLKSVKPSSPIVTPSNSGKEEIVETVSSPSSRSVPQVDNAGNITSITELREDQIDVLIAVEESVRDGIIKGVTKEQIEELNWSIVEHPERFKHYWTYIKEIQQANFKSGRNFLFFKK
jgi:hypothetical protein